MSSSAINVFEVQMEVLKKCRGGVYGTKVGCRLERRERGNRQPANVVLEAGSDGEKERKREKVVMIKEVCRG